MNKYIATIKPNTYGFDSFEHKLEAENIDDAHNAFNQYCSMYDAKFENLHKEILLNPVLK
jgi:hypothetical protein